MLEEVRRDFQPIVFGAVFVAAAIADIVTRIGAGQFPVFAVPSYPMPPLTSLPIFAVLGVMAGVLGVLFNRGLLTAIRSVCTVAGSLRASGGRHDRRSHWIWLDGFLRW